MNNYRGKYSGFDPVFIKYVGSKYGNMGLLQRNPKKSYGKICWKYIKGFFFCFFFKKVHVRVFI